MVRLPELALPGQRRRRCGAVVLALAILLAMALPASQAPAAAIAGVPDFSQDQVAGWRNFCAPTCGTDVSYYFGRTFASLLQGNPTGPGNQPAADSGASSIIAGLNAPFPVANTMAGLMQSTTGGGTTLNNLQAGLDAYLEANDGIIGNNNWNTTILKAGAMGGANFWKALKGATDASAGVILAIEWKNGVPAGYEVPDNYAPSDESDSAIGHAMTMVGYNGQTISVLDPANNAGNAHIWPANVVPDTYNVTIAPNDLTILMPDNITLGTIYAAVITTPEPGTLALLGFGLIAMGRRKARGRART